MLWPVSEERDAESFFWHEICTRPLAKMQAERMAFADTLIIGLAERAGGVDAFVTWDAHHFGGTSSLTVLTPQESLEAVSSEE